MVCKPTFSRRWWVMIGLAVGLAATDVIVGRFGHLWRSYDPDDYVERLGHCRNRTWDLVLVGGSPTSEGIDPSVLAGLRWQGRAMDRVYNLGLPAGTTAEVWHAVKHGVTRPPRLLVYGVTASDMNDDRNEAHGPHSIMDRRDVAQWVAHRRDSAEWVIRHYLQGRLHEVWRLYHYRQGIRGWAADRLEAVAPGLCPHAAAEARKRLAFAAALRRGDGYAPRPIFHDGDVEQAKAEGCLLAGFNFLHNYRLGESDHLAYLRQLTAWARTHDVPLVLLDMPVTEDLERLHPDAFARYREVIGRLAREEGLMVLRARREATGLADRHFADLIHLNARGVARFSRWLREELERVGDESAGGLAVRPGASRSPARGEGSPTSSCR